VDLAVSFEPVHLPTPGGGFVHPLLRARDWQDRPEFGELRQWWTDGGIGACALVGIGGAGKTAIAERFLQVLPGGYPEHPKVPKDRNLPAPARLFVFSFYDVPNPDTFFAKLAAWLEGRPPTPKDDDVTRPPSYQQTLDLLAVAGKCLLVLDGLEKAQDDGSRGGAFGQILDGRLRDFVLRVADGWLPQVSLMITSRFRLFDPPALRAWYYQQIGVEKLQPAAAVHLLRNRGVRGTDGQLEDVAREQGFHALSVDLVGGYIARFCGGDPQQFSSLNSGPTVAVDPALDPRVYAIREQERKFSHLAEQYHLALAQSDPVALALLQRICLFRLGVGAKTLTAIFTGDGKRNISGSLLARLNERQIHSKLQLLVEMRLIEASKSQILNQESKIYTVHPAVRDGFLEKLDAESTRLGHEAVRMGLETSLGGWPGSYPFDPATLDLFEEIIFHTLAAGLVEEAWDIYWNRTGRYGHLGRCLGRPQQGRRLCGYFLTESKEAKILGAVQQSWLFNNLGLFCRDLGMLDEARQFYEKSIALRRRPGAAIALGIRNLGQICYQRGRLLETLRNAKAALDEGRSTFDKILASALAAQASFLMGDVAFGVNEFDGKSRNGWPTDDSGRPMFYPAVWKVSAVYRMGRKDDARAKARELLLSIRPYGQILDEMRLSLVLADISIHEGNISAARVYLDSAYRWALDGGENELLCWSALVRTKMELASFSDQPSANPMNPPEGLEHLMATLEGGLRIARDCGYGIYHIDLLLVRAQLALYEGRATDAERDLRVALDEGVHPSAESGFPELLAATDPECLYAWGIVEGRHLLAEALLLQAAQKLGQADSAPNRLDRLPAEVQDLIGRAREQLDQALELWRQLRDPESEADINPRGERTRRVIEQLNGGVLTEYPLAQKTQTTDEPQKEPIPMPPVPSAAGIDVFLSHNSKDKPVVRQLGEELKKRGMTVWLDEWDLVPGRPWQEALEEIVQTTRAAAVLVGSDGMGPWQDREMRGCLSEFVGRGLPVIPVLLPGAPSKPDLPMFLKQLTWVDLRGGLTKEGLDRIQWGVTGKRP
jgi:tetratricopeptide (TPR) repeat protein